MTRAQLLEEAIQQIKKDQAEQVREIQRSVVRRLTKGNIRLQQGKYKTAADLEVERTRVLAMDFNEK